MARTPLAAFFNRPLLRHIGELWHQGKISISGEHSVTRIIRNIRSQLCEKKIRTVRRKPSSPACRGEYHEVAPFTAAFLLRNRGWQAT